MVYLINLLVILEIVTLIHSQNFTTTSTKILSGSKKISYKIKKSFEEFQMRTNYKKLNITIDKLTNINSVIFTDKPYEDTNFFENSLSISACPNNSSFCQSK